MNDADKEFEESFPPTQKLGEILKAVEEHERPDLPEEDPTLEKLVDFSVKFSIEMNRILRFMGRNGTRYYSLKKIGLLKKYEKEFDKIMREYDEPNVRIRCHDRQDYILLELCKIREQSMCEMIKEWAPIVIACIASSMIAAYYITEAAVANTK